jgi:hypothetical protein
MSELVMCKIGGDWIVGTKYDLVRIDNPRLYLFDGTQHGFMNLPGNPDVIFTEGVMFWYPLMEGQIVDLYNKQVSKLIQLDTKITTPN